MGVAYGPPGVGKSTLTTSLAISAARRTSVVYVAAEEGHSSALMERFKRCGLDDLAARRLRISDARSLVELDEDLATAEEQAIVVVDSLTELRCKIDTLAHTLAGRSWWCTQHVTTAGVPRGGLEAAHLADIVLEVRAGGLVTPEKNRWGVMDPINVFTRKVAA